MEWEVTEVRVVGDYTLWVRFRDHLEGRVEILPSFFRGVFEPLRDPAKFREVSSPDGFVTWPGELDLAPDAMYDEIKAHGAWVLG
jgi:hypothetical protein